MSQYFHELKQYMDFSSADEEALRMMYPIARPYFEDIVEDFYQRLLSYPSAAGVFRSEAQVLRLQSSLIKWMDRLLSGPWCDDYFELRARIGKVHVEINMPQHFMFSAMALIQSHLAKIAWANCKIEDANVAVLAVQKITNIDLAIMLQSYRNFFVGRVVDFEAKEKVQLTSRLEVTQARYHSIFESSGVSILIVNKEHEIVLVNSMAEEMTGFSREQLSGQNLVEKLAHPLEAGKMITMLSEAGSVEGASAHELRLVTATKGDKWIRWHMNAIDETDDICLLGVDVTSQRKLARQTRRVETLAALGTLAAGLAHEIRNPLNAAQLQLMLVERAIAKAGDAVDKKALSSSSLVKSELSRLGGLVEDFLAFARPSGLRVSSAELSDICHSVAALLDGDAKEAGVELQIEAEHDVFARADSEKLKQVLINLLRNGIEAAGEAGVVLLRCYRIAQNVYIEVIDSGPGIPEHIDIFEPFATSKEGGTGLGLPIVHRIVTDHDGVLTVSRRDDRTVFSVELPVDGPG